MSYAACSRSGGACTGCMMCLKDRKPEYYRRRDYNEWTAEDAVDWFCSGWECLLAIIKHCDLFAEDNEEFARVPKVVNEDEVDIYWDDGLMSYPRDEVEEWQYVDFLSYLALSDGNAYIAVMERENREMTEQKNKERNG